MKVTDFINGPVTYDEYGQYFWINRDLDDQQLLGQLRGWGHIQHMYQFKMISHDVDLHAAMAFQDEIGEFIAQAINEKIQREFNPKER